MLPLKTVPEVNNRRKQTHTLKPKAKVMATAPPKKKARVRSVKVEEIEDQDSTCNIAVRNSTISPTHSFHIPDTKKKGTGQNSKKSPIYLFYEIVTNGPDGTPGDDGDVHYCCLHGTHKVCMIKRSMRSNLNGLMNNLRIHVKPMYQLYYILKDSQAAGPWDQERFEQCLVEWIIACDQPFDEVEKPEFVAMMNFTHHTGGPLKIPQCNAIKQRVMKMGEQTIEGIQQMFLV
ncbi:hypothetical protein BYT27DRAFT_7222707 [Phlegmacium glaucopus]|nr:hypothetical protein BYT27DRAFT_7222707 [Phlegmacium glaucopus]